ncbi:hypothetical protein J2Z65_004337 [Paenibacillus aceris]|uniref:Uncharacterized protein n=1 Tax=Paenibacillus aceris TaxID=869555 RepID=A0ABS4I2H6_9BACL|nr:hypothetical protein [Paenibacillus aceris]
MNLLGGERGNSKRTCFNGFLKNLNGVTVEI